MLAYSKHAQYSLQLTPIFCVKDLVDYFIG